MIDVKPGPKCACKSDDPYRCFALRYPTPLSDDPPEEEEACECPCHDEWYEEEDEYLAPPPSDSENREKVAG
jgi:hypothetical protein